MFDPRQRQMGRPMGRLGWLQQLGQGLAQQRPEWGQPGPWGGQGGPQGPQGMPPQGMPPQGAPMVPPGVRFGPPGGQMPPQAAGPDGRPMVPPGAGFMRDNDAAVRAALARRGGQPMPMQQAVPQGVAAPNGVPQEAPQDQDNDPQLAERRYMR